MADSFFDAPRFIQSPNPRSLSDQKPLPHPARKPAETETRPVLLDERRLRLILLAVIGLMVLIVAGEVVFQLAVAPRLLLQRIVLDSDLAISQSEILAAAGVSIGQRFYDQDPRAIEQRLASLAAVSEVKAERVFPDTLQIRMRSRQAVVVTLVETAEGSQVPVQIDHRGYVFAWGMPPQRDDFPVLSGVEFRNFRIGMQLPPMVLPLLQDLEALRLKAPALYQAFSEFRLEPVGNAQLEMLAYTISSPVPVRLSARLSEERALYVLRTMDMLARTEGLDRVKVIDFRTNDAVYAKGVD